MYAVIRHTFELDTEDKYNSVADWKHYVWLFETEEEAMTFAVTLLDHPVGKVLERLEVVADDEVKGEDDDEKSIH